MGPLSAPCNHFSPPNNTTMKFSRYIRPILLALACQAFGFGLVACKTLGNVAITYAERRGAISPADAADLRAAGLVAVGQGQPAVTTSK